MRISGRQFTRDRFSLRVGLLFGSFLLLFSGVFARCAWLTIAEADEGVALQDRYALSPGWVPARRGEITDARGITLARDRSRWIVAIDPWAASGRLAGARILGETAAAFERNCPERLRTALEELLRLEGFQPLADPDEILTQLIEDQKLASKRQFRVIGRIDSVESYERFLEHRQRVHRERWITFPMPREETVREYPLCGVAMQVVGDTSSKGTPYFGIEERFDPVLSGMRGIEVAQVDGIGRNRYAVPDDANGVTAHPGAAIELTIEVPAQIALEIILRETLEKTGATMVSGLVMDPRTGAIIAAASVPTCGRGTYGGYFRQVIASHSEDTPGDAAAQMTSFVDPEAFGVQLMASLFPMSPGSIMKPLVLGRALDLGMVRLTDPVHVDGTHNSQRYGRAVRHYTDSHPLHDRTVRGSVVESSNAGMGEVGAKLGTEPLQELLADLEFGAGTGFDLSEASGRLPGQRGALPWNDHTTLSIPIGYELLVTQVQIARGYAAIANGGWLITPHVVRRIDGVATPNAASRRVYSAETSEALRKVLREVVTRGTGHELDGDAIRLAGKTGTAAHYDKHGKIEGWYTSSFAGFAPAEAPRYVAVVTVERPSGETYYASKTAAPAVLEILKALLGDPGGNRFRALLADALAGSGEAPIIAPGLHGEDGRWGTPAGD